MKKAVMQSAKNTHECSGKDCVCGSHSAGDAKKNRHHNSTKKKLLYRKSKKAKLKNIIP